MVIIRADANEIIGTGHVMRCLSIARTFADRGKEVKFVTADHKGDGLIHSKGFETVCLNSKYDVMNEENIVPVIMEYAPSLVLVDSYYATQDYMHTLSTLSRTAYLDDLNAEVWDVDYLINYNIFGTVIDYSGYNNSRVSLLLGPKFAPLRPEFVNAPKHIIKPVTDVMVSAGGSDPEKITEKIMESICSKYMDICFHFIVGALNPRLDKIKSLVKPNMNLHINEQNMSGLMHKCDIAISAAGSTLYELCACGTPTITYTLADNQLLAAEEFERQGLMINAGDCRKNVKFIKNVANRLEKLIVSAEKRIGLSERMQSLVDGYGAERIIEGILL